MIKLNKNTEPAVLTSNKFNWTNELREHIDKKTEPPKSLLNKYNNAEVKKALRAESFSKCIYCESKVEHSSDFHIEHIKPKAKDKFPELTFEYSNLGLACTICNRNKSDAYDPLVPFINPYEDDPSNHFIAFGAFIWGVLNDKRAKLTEIRLDLNRKHLVEIRGERLKTLKGLIESYITEENQIIKESIATAP